MLTPAGWIQLRRLLGVEAFCSASWSKTCKQTLAENKRRKAKGQPRQKAMKKLARSERR